MGGKLVTGCSAVIGMVLKLLVPYLGVGGWSMCFGRSLEYQKTMCKTLHHDAAHADSDTHTQTIELQGLKVVRGVSTEGVRYLDAFLQVSFDYTG